MSNKTEKVTISNAVYAANANVPGFARHEHYTLEQLVGDAFWRRIPKARRTTLEAEFKEETELGWVKFDLIIDEGEDHELPLYRLK